MPQSPGEPSRERDCIMRTAVSNGPNDVTIGERPGPVVQVSLACVCGADAYDALHDRRAMSFVRVGAR